MARKGSNRKILKDLGLTPDIKGAWHKFGKYYSPEDDYIYLQQGAIGKITSAEITGILKEGTGYVLTYDECRSVIDRMKFVSDSDLFGNEKDDSFKGSIGAIYQSFDGKDLYPSLEEKAANLLYFVTKNHSFSDGNKRIAATMFLYFLDKNKALFVEGTKRIADYTLVALTIMIAESKPEEKEMIVNVIMNCLI